MTYNMLYKLILKGNYDKEDMLTKLDTFYANGRITQAQYMELLEMVLSDEETLILNTQEAIPTNGWSVPFKSNTDVRIKMPSVKL